MIISATYRRIINISHCERVLHRNNNQRIFNILRSVSTVKHSANNNIVYSTFDDIKFPELSIPEYVYQNFGKHPNKIAVGKVILGCYHDSYNEITEANFEVIIEPKNVDETDERQILEFLEHQNNEESNQILYNFEDKDAEQVLETDILEDSMECSSTGRKYTYEELRRKSKNFAGALQKKFNLHKGNVITLMMPNIPEFPICLLGALEAGLVVTTVHTAYTVDELRQRFYESTSKLMITVADLWPVVHSVLNKFPIFVPTVIIKQLRSEALPTGTINFQECIDTKYDLDEIRNIDFDTVAILAYSSGTSGLPKGVDLSSKNIVSSLLQFQDPFSQWGGLTTDTYQDIVPNILPWSHAFGMTSVLLFHLFNLSKLISMPKFSVSSYINMLVNHRPNILYIAPPIAVLMNSSLVKQVHLESLDVILSAAAPLSSLDEYKLQEKAGKEINIVQGYGLTEASGFVLMLTPLKKKKYNIMGSVGEPLGSMKIKIVPVDNPSGAELGPNQCGELLIKGPCVTKSYHNKPEETRNAFLDGWFRTGDMAYYDDNNCFYIIDRIKDLIKVKGYQVAPAELEKILKAYPGVANSAVIGVPHERYGEVPKAYIVQHKDANICIKKLEEYVASKVATFKQLKGGIVLTDAIPVSPTGKVLRKQLKLLHDKDNKVLL